MLRFPSQYIVKVPLIRRQTARVITRGNGENMQGGERRKWFSGDIMSPKSGDDPASPNRPRLCYPDITEVAPFL